MVKDIVRDDFLLSRKSIAATKEDLSVAHDLIDTLEANKNRCVGMAANMIGVAKRIIIIHDNGKNLVMINPIVLKTGGKYYQTEEGCLSHDGVKPVKRYEKIKIEYEDMAFKKKIKTFHGFSAQIVQHEFDHLEGILI